MAFKVTLDSIREGIERKYQTFDIEFGDEVLVLENPMRLSKESRDALLGIQEVFTPKKGEDGEDGEVSTEDIKAAFQEVIRVTAKAAAVADAFIEEVAELGDPDELLVLSDVFEAYMSDHQVGEA